MFLHEFFSFLFYDEHRPASPIIDLPYKLSIINAATNGTIDNYLKRIYFL